MYLIIWSHRAHRQIYEILDGHPADDARITSAIREMYQLLQDDPANWGESREDTRRLGFVDPLWMSFPTPSIFSTSTTSHIVLAELDRRSS